MKIDCTDKEINELVEKHGKDLNDFLQDLKNDFEKNLKTKD